MPKERTGSKHRKGYSSSPNNTMRIITVCMTPEMISQINSMVKRQGFHNFSDCVRHMSRVYLENRMG